MKITEYIKSNTETLNMLAWLVALFSCAHFLLSLDLQALEAGQGQVNNNLYLFLAMATSGILFVLAVVFKLQLVKSISPAFYTAMTVIVATAYNTPNETNGLPALATATSGAFTTYLFPLIAFLIIARIAFEAAKTGALSIHNGLNFAAQKTVNSLALMVLAIFFLMIATPESVNTLRFEGAHDAVIMSELTALAFMGFGISQYILLSSFPEENPHEPETLGTAKMIKAVQGSSAESS